MTMTATMENNNKKETNLKPKQPQRRKKLKQYFNILIHKEPFESIVYGIFWFVFLFVAIPLIALIVVLPLTVYKIIDWFLDYNLGVNYGYYDPLNDTNNDKEMAIFVNGCDIIQDEGNDSSSSSEDDDCDYYGQNIVLWAANSGFVVFAACTNDKSVKYYLDKNKEKESTSAAQQQQKRFKNMKGRIIPILMDVTKDDSVKKAAAQVSAWINNTKNSQISKEDDTTTTITSTETKQRVLHALINNNCGKSNIPGYFDWLDIEDCQKSFDINYFGMMRCCKAFVPLFKQQRYGRIINLTSIAGLLPGSSFFWNFSSTQHACQVFSEGIRKELSNFNIDVTTINPSFTQIQIIDSIEHTINNMWNNRMDQKQKDQIGEERVKSALRSDAMKITSGFPMKHVQPNKELEQIVVDKVLEILQLRGRGDGGIENENDENNGGGGGGGGSVGGSSSLPAQVIVGADAKFYWILMRMLPGWFLSLEPPPAIGYGPKKKTKQQ